MRLPHRNIGECIYCGPKTPPLTREHVMPRGLGGDDGPDGEVEALVLQNSTCVPCQKITSKIEEFCLTRMLGPLRVRRALTRKDRRKAKSKILITDRSGNTTVREDDHRHLIGVMALPAFRAAKIFAPGGITTGPDVRLIWPHAAKQLPDPNIASVGARVEVNNETFARMLAKIALGTAVARLGVRGFTPLVGPLILGLDNDFTKYVGGLCEELKEPPKDPVMHRLNLREHGPYLVVDIQLFAEDGGPVNYVVVGTKRMGIDYTVGAVGTLAVVLTARRAGG